MSKKIIILSLINILSISAYAIPQDVVSMFGEYMSSWCNTDNITYRSRIEDLCTGVKSCRVEDKIHADYQRKRGYMDYETYVLDSYLNMFETLISSGVQFSISNINVETQDVYPDGQVLTFITADVRVSGKINYNVKDLFLVRDNKISGIYTYSSKYGFQHLNGSLIKTLKKGKYRMKDYYLGLSDFEKIVLVDQYNKEGVIDIKGNIVIPFEWDEITYFGGEFARVLNHNTEYIYDVRMGKRTPFSEVINLGKSSEIFRNGNAIVQDVNTKKWGLLNENDLTYKSIKFYYDYPPSFFDENGMSHIIINGKSAIINTNNNIVIQDNNKYEVLHVIGENLFKVRSRATNNVGAININYEEIIPCIYDWVYANSEGMIKVRLNGKIGFVNTYGELIIPCIYEEEDLGTIIQQVGDPYNFHNGYCLVGRKDSHSEDSYYQPLSHAFIDKSGKIILPFGYTYSSNPLLDQIEYCESLGGYYTVINRSDCKQTIVDLNGNIIKGFSWYDKLGYEHDGILSFEEKGKEGFLNTKGTIIIPPIYDSVSWFEDGYTNVTKKVGNENKYGLINTQGTLIIPCIYDTNLKFVNGISIVEKNGVLGLIDLFGNSYFFE